MANLFYEYASSTGSVLSIQWSDLGDVARRKQSFGGSMNAWEATRVGDFIYLIPAGVTVQKIDTALTEALLPSDRAVLTYPHGSDENGHSAMRIRLYGKAASDAAKS
jgi:hypothetical protein